MSPQTRGFEVSERLNPQYADARLLTPRYDAIIPALSQGLGAAQQFAQIVDTAQERPVRRQLQQIQLDEAKARLALLPVEQQLAAIRLGEAQQQAAIPEFVVDGSDIVGGEPRLSARNIDAGFGNIEFAEEFTPRERVTRGRQIGAGGIVSPFERRETLASVPQVKAEIAKAALDAETKRALNTQRLRGKEFESTVLPGLIEDARAEGDMEKVAMYQARLDKLNAVRPALTDEDFYSRRIAQLAADAGITMEQASRLSKTVEGAEALALAAVSNRAAARSPFGAPELSPEQRALLRGEAVTGGGRQSTDRTPSDDFAKRTNDILGEGDAPRYSSAEDVKADFKAGKITKEEATKILRDQFKMK